MAHVTSRANRRGDEKSVAEVTRERWPPRLSCSPTRSLPEGNGRGSGESRTGPRATRDPRLGRSDVRARPWPPHVRETAAGVLVHSALAVSRSAALFVVAASRRERHRRRTVGSSCRAPARTPRAACGRTTRACCHRRRDRRRELTRYTSAGTRWPSVVRPDTEIEIGRGGKSISAPRAKHLVARRLRAGCCSLVAVVIVLIALAVLKHFGVTGRSFPCRRCKLRRCDESWS